MASYTNIVLTVFVVLVSVEYSTQQAFPAITIVKDDRTQNRGDYSFTYETSDGQLREEAGTQNDGQVSQGRWSYTAPDGTPVEISFNADQGGYQPVGDILPVAPPLFYQRDQVY